MRKKPDIVHAQAAKSNRAGNAAPHAVTLVFHTGLHKTGSTALQAYLAHNAASLKEANVAYASPTGKGGGPGNGQQLCELLQKGELSANQLDDLLTFHLDKCPTAIISSEDFSHFGMANWERIAEAGQRLHARIRIVTFVRDLAPYLASLHAQLLSGGETTLTFTEFAARSEIFAHVMNSLKCLAQAFHRDAMTLIHYESAVGAIDKAFLGSLGLPRDAYDATPLSVRVNRSLTEYEQGIIIRFAQSAGTHFARDLSRHLKARRPALTSTRCFDAKLLEQLGLRFRADLDWINETFFGGESIVQVAHCELSSPSDRRDSEATRQSIDHDVLEWCIDRLKTSQDKSFLHMGRLLREIDWHLAGNPLIPPDFDPLAYLAYNPDIVRGGAPPFRHFITSGHKEPNRIWKWTN